MRVEPLITQAGKERYMLVDSNGVPVEPVLKYLKFKDYSGSARNTMKTYCYRLKLFFEYLESEELSYKDIGIDEMATFIRWLQNPFSDSKVISFNPIEPKRSAVTINAIVSTVTSFYDYLLRHEELSNQLSQKLKKQAPGAFKGYRGFLHHINKNKSYSTNILKLKTPKKRPKTITKKQVSELINHCSNSRDKFLIQLLWEGSMRIGEALSLWLEDFKIDEQKIQICDRGELVNNAEIKTVNSPRIIDVSDDLMNCFLSYVAEHHTDDVDTSHVFIKLSGKTKNYPMEYPDVYSLFIRLRKKTGINFIAPHILRHSSLTELRRAGWRDEHLMKRSGHSQIQTLMNMYIHPSDEDIRKEWEMAEKQMQIKTKERTE